MVSAGLPWRRPAAPRSALAGRVAGAAVRWLALGALGMLGTLGGCASSSADAPATLRYSTDELPAGLALVWPAPPEPARFVYAGSLSGERNFSAAASASRWRAFGRWLVGLDDNDRPELLQRPAAVLHDPAGQRLYVSDTGRQAVFVFDQAAGRLQVWDRAGGLLRLHSPGGLALAADGGLFVADAQLGVVLRLDRQGEPQAEIGRGQLQRPTGLARDATTGRLFVADTQAHDIKVYDPRSGALLATLGGRGEAPGRFNFPTHLAWARGALYVTDTFNQRVQVLSGGGLDGTAALEPAAVQARSIGRAGLQLGDLVRPKGVAVDGAGRVYVVESYYDSLLVYDAHGDFLLPVGAGVGAAGLVADRWQLPAATATAAAAAAAHADPAGAGVGADRAGPAAVAAPGAAARFFLPAGVWADADGQVWVADQFKGRVVRLRYVGPPEAAEVPAAQGGPAAVRTSGAGG
ncbi:MAG: hypothetical protein RIQ60_3822 [Pseudomonadota bacterium]|jgi:DNA-binding beta-propeller fold protein YncE